MEKPEILAPAGGMEALRAAIAAGADAVYIGGSSFGARAYAENPEKELLLEAIEYTHLRGKRLYLTVNTLVKDREFDALYELIAPYYEAGLDAAIVQDMGVLRFLAGAFPGLALHASTQMTLTAAKGLEVLREYPVTRLVPARELSLVEIADICKTSKKEVEIFVHGALCFCYSGKCLMSSLIGGRSGNRGRCAQPCRMEYEYEKGGKKYWLSPKDLCGLPLLPELIETGAASFKIEGRMKRPEYTAAVTAAYRKFTDLYFELGAREYREYIKKNPGILERELERMADVYNRGNFTEGCLKRHNGQEMMSMQRPGHFGVFVGEVVKGGKGEATVQFAKDVFPQDVLEFRRESDNNPGTAGYYEYTLGTGAAAGTRTNARLLPKLTAKTGDRLYRMRNGALLKELEDSFLKKEYKQKIQGRFYATSGEACTLEVWTSCEGQLPAEAFPKLSCTEVSVLCRGFVCEKAGKLPAVPETVEKQLRKTGNEVFDFDSLEVVLEDDVFLPNGLLNELRRTALNELKEKLIGCYVREPKETNDSRTLRKQQEQQEKTGASEKREGRVPFTDCTVSTPGQARAAAKVENLRRIYLDFEANAEGKAEISQLVGELHRAGKEVWYVFPRICRKETLERIRAEFSKMQTLFDGYLVRNYETLALVKELEANPKSRICLDAEVYVMNREAKRFYEEMFDGRSGMLTAPRELSATELDVLDISDMTLIVYGQVPVMTSVHCLKKNAGCCEKGRKKDNSPEVLTDRMGKKVYVKVCCEECYNVLYNPECLLIGKKDLAISGLAPWAVRYDFTFETEQEVLRLLSGNSEGVSNDGKYTRGHFRRGVE